MQEAIFFVTDADPAVQHSVSHIDDLPEAGVLAVILDLADAAQRLAAVKQLRHRPAYRLTPLFYQGSVAETQISLFDGPFSQQAIALATQIQAQIRVLAERVPEHLNNQSVWLLAYLFVRTTSSVTPLLKGVLDYQEPRGFAYPLMAIWESNATVLEQQLATMVSEKFIEPDQFVAYLRGCPHCHSALFNFQYACPACNALSIVQKDLIHCFACEMIGGIQAFSQGKDLVCPGCQSVLRHQGMDYDKLLEDKVCLDCAHFFVDPRTTVRCLVCLEAFAETTLTLKRHCHYRLGKRGETLITGLDHRLHTRLNEAFTLLQQQTFYQLIDWQLDLVKRHEDVFFSICGLKIVNEKQMAASVDLFEWEAFLEQWFSDLKKAFRHTDLVTRDGDLVLFLLPMTRLTSKEPILKKIRASIKQQNQVNPSNPIKVGLSFLSSDTLAAEQCTGSQIVEAIYAHMIFDGRNDSKSA